jgi:kynurenine formamidase
MPLVAGTTIVRLSHLLRVDDPLPPAIPPLQVAPKMSLAAGDDANVYILTLANHSGTHADAPRHVEADGLPITAFAPHEFHFTRPVVVDLPLPDGAVVGPRDLAPHAAAIAQADLLLLRFGYGPVRSREPARYRDQCPGFGVEGAAYLREQFPELRAIGMDVPSFSCIRYLDETMRAHNVVLGGSGRRFLIIEDLNLDQDLSGLSEVWVAPLLVDGTDSAPCTVFGVVQ